MPITAAKRSERARLHGLDQRVGSVVADLPRLLAQCRGVVLGAVGVFVDEVLGALDRVVDRFRPLLSTASIARFIAVGGIRSPWLGDSS